MAIRISSLKHRVIASAIGLVVIGSVLAPIGAHAEDNGPSGVPGKSCAVEVDGTVQQVPVGTHAGLFYCGADGDWHLGWLVDGMRAPKPTRFPVGPVRLSAAQFARLELPPTNAGAAADGATLETLSTAPPQHP